LLEDIYNLKIKEIKETYKNGDKSITNQSLNELESKSNNIENNSNIEYNKENLDKDIDRITSKISRQAGQKYLKDAKLVYILIIMAMFAI
jgi:hypothetical protein